MALDLKMILAQHKELKGYADDIAYVRRQIKRYQDNLNGAWKSSENRMINSSIDELEHRLSKMETEMDEIGMDILEVYQELEETQPEEI